MGNPERMHAAHERGNVPWAAACSLFTWHCAMCSSCTTHRRRTDVMPAPPREVKHHPSSVDLELIKRLSHITKVCARVCVYGCVRVRVCVCACSCAMCWGVRKQSKCSFIARMHAIPPAG